MATKNEIAKEYYASTRISNSLLKSIQNPRLFQLKREHPELFENEDSTALRVGSAVDCLLTSPESWESSYKVLDVNKPYGLMGTFVQFLPKGISVTSSDEMYEKAYWQSGYKMSLAWVIQRFWNTPEAVEYYQVTRNSPEEITILSKDEYDSVVKAVELIRVSPYAASYFVKERTWEELLLQVPIYFDFEKEKCKALLDGIKINHKDKTIEPFDLKTIGKSVFDFKTNYLNYGYYTQAAFYNYALRTKKSPVFDLLKEGYRILNFIFIVVETKTSSTNPAIIYESTDQDLIAGMEGGVYDGKYYKGLVQLMEDYKWHKKNDQWVYPREIYENEGRIKLNYFG